MREIKASEEMPAMIRGGFIFVMVLYRSLGWLLDGVSSGFLLMMFSLHFDTLEMLIRDMVTCGMHRHFCQLKDTRAFYGLPSWIYSGGLPGLNYLTVQT